MLLELISALGVLSLTQVNGDLGDDFLAATPIHPSFRIPDVFAPDEDKIKIELVKNFNSTFIPFADCNVTKDDLKAGDFGSIMTPNYPRNYPGRTSCQWVLQSAPGTKIEVTIFDLFTQPWFFTYFDYVMVTRDGNFTAVDRMAGDMNRKTPLTITSESNKFGVRFKSSTLFNFRGFKMQYLVKPTEDKAEPLPPSPYDNVCGESNILNDHPGPPTTAAPGRISRGQSVDDLIIGPDSASSGSFPYMAAMLIDGRSFCGGSLIDEQHILTAAHCTDGAKKITILLGSLDIKNKNEAGRLVFNVTRENIFQHPDYNPNTISHDITVIKLPNKVKYTENIKPVCLPNRYYMDKTFVGEEVRVSGWGKPSDLASGISPILKNTTVQVMSNGNCRAFFRSIVTGNLICIATKIDASPCRGDSGGPLVIRQNSPTGKPYLMQLGIVSFGGNSCQKGFPVGFTRVTAFLDYISSVTSMTF